MPTTRTYSPLPPMIPAGDIFCANPRVLQEPDSCPHTYGVRVCSCAAFATEPCRPTACISAAPFRHTPCRFRPRRTATVWRNLQQHPQCADATTTLHSPLSTLHSSHTFSAKERDSETGLSYFGSRYYSSDLSIWLSVDPMSGKYPSLSPYVYCADNPVKLVDPNGETPRIYCETTGLGHAFITTGEGENTVVYTYGRYLGGGKGKSSANSLDPSGKGVLLRLEGKEAQRYIKHELKDKDAKCFEVTDASDANIDSYFNNLFASGRTLNSEEASCYDSNPNKYGTSDNARVIDKYDLLTNNCVSKTIAGAKAGGSKNYFLQKRYYISTVSSIPVEYSVQPKSPKHLQQYLQNCSQQKGSTIKEVTDIINAQF